MNNPVQNGPTFTAVAQDHPCAKIRSVGIEMTWGHPVTHRARLYHNQHDRVPKVFRFDRLVIHEEDCPEDFEYPARLARDTKVGMFYPLSAYLFELYDLGTVARDIFSVLGELDRLLPTERLVTAKDDALTGHKAGPDNHIVTRQGILAPDLERRGFFITRQVYSHGSIGLNVVWKAQPDTRSFFTGFLDLIPGPKGSTVQWIQGPPGVNRLLCRKFQQISKATGAVLTPDGQEFCFPGRPGRTSTEIGWQRMIEPGPERPADDPALKRGTRSG